MEVNCECGQSYKTHKKENCDVTYDEFFEIFKKNGSLTVTVLDGELICIDGIFLKVRITREHGVRISINGNG